MSPRLHLTVSTILALCAVMGIRTPASGAEPAHEARTADGETFPARLLAVSTDWQIVLKSDGKRRTLPAKSLVRWGNPVEIERGAVVVTANRGLIRVIHDPALDDAVEIVDDTLRADSDLFEQVRLPLESMRGVVLQQPADSRQREALLQEIGSAKADSDRLYLINGDQLGGTLLGMTDGEVQLENRTGRTKIPVEKVMAIQFNPTLVETSAQRPQQCLVGYRDGTLLATDQLVVSDGAARLTVGGGISLSTSPENVSYLQPIGQGVEYVSDKKAENYRHIPYLSLPFDYQIDRNVTGGRLKSGGRVYQKGLGMHSASRITYLLKKPYRRFAAEVAIDDAAGKKGSVVFRVFANSGDGWKLAHASEVVRGGQPPVPVSVDLTGIKAITLIVDYADRGDELDHANWLDARLVE